MRILPTINTPIITKPAFQQKPNLKVLKSNEAQILLNNYESVTQEHFKDGYIYNGLAKLGFETYESNGRKNIENFKKLYVHTLINLGLKVEELRLDVAFKEGIENSNYYFMKLMIEDMKMLPIKPDGKIDHLIYYNGYLAKGRYRGPIEKLLKDADKEILFKKNIFGNYIPPARHNSAKIAFLNQTKDMINQDEENKGIVSINTIYNIVSHTNFSKIKDESLNISGSKILHILAESSFDTNNQQETSIVENIIQKCADLGYDFNIKNDFDETALDKAQEAENNFLIDILNKRRTKC